MRIAKWGNSLAVRLPAAVVEVLGLMEGDDVEIHVDEPRRFRVRKSSATEDVLARLRAYRGRMPADFKFERLDANRRG